MNQMIKSALTSTNPPEPLWCWCWFVSHQMLFFVSSIDCERIHRVNRLHCSCADDTVHDTMGYFSTGSSLAVADLHSQFYSIRQSIVASSPFVRRVSSLWICLQPDCDAWTNNSNNKKEKKKQKEEWLTKLFDAPAAVFLNQFTLCVATCAVASNRYPW